jgi:ATP-dependent Lhr-like helicase
MVRRAPIYGSMTSASSSSGVLDDFHPAVASWFLKTFPAPTDAQTAAWPLIRSGRSTLVAAPTGSGKTLTAFLSALDDLVQQGLANGGGLPDETLVVYVSPLKALSNDIRLNLQVPLEGIAAELAQRGLPPLDIRTAVRTGDTTQQERNALKKRAPHILVTTPESLYVLLGSDSGRRMLATTRLVSNASTRSAAGTCRASACPPRKSLSRPWHVFWWAAQASRAKRLLTARSSTLVMCANATSRWRFRQCRSKR